MKALAIAALAASTLSALPVMAQQPWYPGGWYAGVGVGRGNLNISGQDLTGLSDASVNDTDTTYTARIGFRPHQYWAVELGYYDLGHYEFNGTSGATNVSGSAKAKSIGLSLVGILPVSAALEFYGRLGYARSEIKTNANTELVNANVKDKQNEATYGLGGRWYFTKNVGVFAEWMKNDKIEVDSYLAGIDFRF